VIGSSWNSFVQVGLALARIRELQPAGETKPAACKPRPSKAQQRQLIDDAIKQLVTEDQTRKAQPPRRIGFEP